MCHSVRSALGTSDTQEPAGAVSDSVGSFLRLLLITSDVPDASGKSGGNPPPIPCFNVLLCPGPYSAPLAGGLYAGLAPQTVLCPQWSSAAAGRKWLLGSTEGATPCSPDETPSPPPLLRPRRPQFKPPQSEGAGVVPPSRGPAAPPKECVVRAATTCAIIQRGMHWKGGEAAPPPPSSRAPSLCPATVPLTASAGFNGICNRH